jgi:4-hydroxythreonine-4-phosphate dehydrogenase
LGHVVAVAGKTKIIVTSGEPAGIGPDLCIGVAERTWPCELIVVGDRRVIGARARQLGKPLAVRDYHSGGSGEPHVMPIAHLPTVNPVIAGKLDVTNASYVLQTLDFAIDGCRRGEFAAMVTAPVQKSIINAAGMSFSGHTEYLAERTQASLPVMMLVAQNAERTLRVALATTHLPLARVSESITPELVRQVVTIIDADLRDKFGIRAPKILVCGLNPHAGESGYLGYEEIETIIPALDDLRRQGIQVAGPAPADTAFTPHMLEQADVVLAMYHDQGLPVLKFAGFGNAVNVTLGLPIIRTSVDHGTALDLAGTGKADAGSLIAAIELAIEMSTANHRTAG